MIGDPAGCPEIPVGDPDPWDAMPVNVIADWQQVAAVNLPEERWARRMEMIGR
jgi:hypothetical protein